MVERRFTDLDNKIKLANQRLRRLAFKVLARPDFEEIMDIIGDANYYTRAHTDKYWVDSLSELGIIPDDALDLVEKKRLVNRDELEWAIESSSGPTSSES